MDAKLLLRDVTIVESLLCLATLAIVIYKQLAREFPFLVAFLAVRPISAAILVPLLFYRREIGIGIGTAYSIYFFTVWISTLLQAILLVAIIYGVYRQAMRPLKGLQKIGNVIFKWVAVVSIAVSIALAIGSHLSTSGYAATIVWSTITSQLLQGTNVLTLCLLLFVCFAIRPLGLTYRSRIFGVTLGLGVTATACLVQAAWLATAGARSLYSPIYLINAIGALTTVCIWGAYFGMPEPQRKLILLPTTSPFFTWNRISEALGDEPGFVAVAGFKPDMLAPAELKVLSSGTSKIERLPSPAVPSEHTGHPSLQSIAVSQ